MQQSGGDAQELSPEQGWQDIHTTMESLRSSMYVAGTAAILLVWGAIISVGYLAEYMLATNPPAFAEGREWIRAPMWGGLVIVGMTASAIIGSRAGRKNMAGEAARSAGIRVFLFWLAIAAAAFVIPAASGLWESGDAERIGRAAIGIASLGYILFGIMNRPIIAVIGVGIAAAYYVPALVVGDAALLVSTALTLGVVAVGWALIRRSGVL